MVGQVRLFCDNQKGSAAIEYGLIAALIALAILVALGGLADEVIAMWNSNSSKMAEAVH
ncbi:Flp family type IVb pilin [Aquamicrobium segne]|uniref:Flp family type IVb pilin n=1 Tax=Aquamicrobium segne TaxID=469547 RepID=A0ABW0GZV3_9HYPH